MAVVEHTIHTKLSTADIGLTFRDYIQERPQGAIAVMWARKLSWRFSTPAEDSNPFATIERSDEPSFRVVAHHSLRKRPLLANDAQVAAWDGSISLDVWDKVQYRLAVIRCLNGPGPKAAVRLVLDQLKVADPGAEIKVSRS